MFRNFFVWFFNPCDKPITPIRTILWWEKRRIPFNIIIGLYGIFSLVVFFWAITTSGHLEPGEDAVEPLTLIAAPFFLNICYTLGWFVEVLLRLINRSITSRLGVRLLKLGLGFSLFIASVPPAFWLIYKFWGHIT